MVVKAPEQVNTARNGCEQYRSLVSLYNWDVNVALAIMRAESGCNHMADNSGLNRDGTSDKGLMQINSIHVTSGLISDQGRYDPAANLDAAYKLYRGAGNSFTPWAAYNSGKHLQYL